MKQLTRHLAPLLVPLLTLACSSADESTPEPTEEASAPPPPSSTPEPGVTLTETGATFTTEPFTLGPGEERFLCYAAEVPEGLEVGGYHHEGRPVLHHIIFSEATEPEPEGMSECDTLFRFTWEPLYLAGAGSSSIDFPEGTGHHLEGGDQLVAQLHLLNSSTEAVTDSVTIELERSESDDPRPIGSFAFGTVGLSLPPLSESTVEGTCELQEDVEIVAAFPHMHLLGKALTFEAGATEEDLEVLFERDPYDFDDQSLTPVDLALSEGDVTRVTCSYDNPYDETITFGESTMNEMCFFIGFSPDRTGVGGCALGGGDVGDPVPIDPEAPACGEHEPTADGVGAPCSAGGNECPADFGCTADYREEGGDGVCFSMGCETSADCGGGHNTCCAPPAGGGAFKICIPEGCRLAECVPQE